MNGRTAASLRTFIGTLLLAMLGCRVAAAQQIGPLVPVISPQGTIVTPLSSRPAPEGGGRVPHTNTRQFLTDNPAAAQPQSSIGVYFETPASLACVYRRIPRSDRCSPSTASATAIGGSRVIAIVDAYDHPNIVADLATYSTKFGLPQANISVVYSSGSRPARDPTGGWEVEEALDVELAHALAPYARIILVEAPTPSDLYTAVDVASRLVAQAGGGEVSMSWGSSEFDGETAYDVHFKTPGWSTSQRRVTTRGRCIRHPRPTWSRSAGRRSPGTLRPAISLARRLGATAEEDPAPSFPPRATRTR